MMAGGAARRRRDRRLRAAWHHEQLSVKMAVAAALHHSAQRGAGPATYSAPRGQTTATEGEVREPNNAPRSQKPPLPGEHPGVLKEPEVQGRIGQHSGIGFELVQALDVPVLQMVEQPVEVDSFFRNFVPAVAEQVIEVPMLALPGCAVQRAALSEPQTVEQLVEVLTVLSYSLLQQRTAEQIIGFPVPGRGGGARGGLQGLPQGQGSTASAGEQTIVPVRGGLQGLPQGQGSTASAVEQTIVVDRLQGFPRGQGSTASAVEQTFSQAPHRSMPRACQLRLGGLPAQGRHDEWVCVVDVENGGEYFWNRLDNSSCWRLPRGVKHRWCLLPSGLFRDVVSQLDYRVLPPL